MKYLSICFLVLFFSCAQHSEKVNVVTEFEVKGELKASVQKIPASIAIVRGMFVSGDYLFLYKQKDSTLFDVFHLPDCQLVSHAGRRGEGPDDFIFLDPRSFAPITGGFTALEAGSQLLKTVQLQADGQLKVSNSQKMFDNVGATNGFYPLANQKYLTLSNINDEHEFVIYGGEGADPLLMKTYPTWATHGVDKPHQRFMTYIKDCVVHPEGGKFAAFYSRFKRFRMFDDAGHLLRDVDVRIEPFSTDIAEDYKEQWVYYTGTPQLVGDYIYVICANKKGNDSKSYRSELQVWDWEGEPVACYELDTPVSYFSISPTHQKLYVYNHETEDELYVYDLPRR